MLAQKGAEAFWQKKFAEYHRLEGHTAMLRTSKGLLLVVSILISAHCASLAQTATPTPKPTSSAEDTGQKIGTIVKTAITTAVPAVAPILDLIWSKTGKGEGDKVKKADLKNSADNQDTAKQLQQQFAAAAQAKIVPVRQVAEQIGIINGFLEPAVLASQHIVAMQVALKSATPDWNLVNKEWGLAKIQIAKTKNVTDAQINKLADIYLRDKLKQIRDTNDSNLPTIDGEMSQKSVTDLKGDLGLLSATLGNMAAVAGYEFADLQGDINFLADWAKGTGGGGKDEPTDQAAVFKKALDENLPK